MVLIQYFRQLHQLAAAALGMMAVLVQVAVLVAAVNMAALEVREHQIKDTLEARVIQVQIKALVAAAALEAQAALELHQLVEMVVLA